MKTRSSSCPKSGETKRKREAGSNITTADKIIIKKKKSTVTSSQKSLPNRRAPEESADKTYPSTSNVIIPTPLERCHMLALGRFYNEQDVRTLKKKCRKGVWSIQALHEALGAIDTADPINEHESREIVTVRNFVDTEQLRALNACFDVPIRKTAFQAGTDSGAAATWCKYLYIKSRKDTDVSGEFKKGVTAALEKRVHACVERSLNDYERSSFKHFFPESKAREISVVHYPCKAKGKKRIGIDPHIDDTIFRTALLHLLGDDTTDNIWIDNRGEMKLFELKPGDLIIFPRLSHKVDPSKRKTARRVCTFFF